MCAYMYMICILDIYCCYCSIGARSFSYLHSTMCLLWFVLVWPVINILIYPSSQVSIQEEALSETLHGLCCNPNTPVCMIRGLCPLLNLNLQLFSSKSIVKTCPDHEMEVREQVGQLCKLACLLCLFFC